MAYVSSIRSITLNITIFLFLASSNPIKNCSSTSPNPIKKKHQPTSLNPSKKASIRVY